MKATKWASLFVIALFAISMVPFVAADEGSDASTESTDVEQDNLKEVSQTSFNTKREELKAQAEVRRKALMAKRTEVRAKLDAERIDLKAMHEQMRIQYRADREKLHAIRVEYKEKRDQLKEERRTARDQLQTDRTAMREVCKADPNSEGCKDAKMQTRVHAREFLTKVLDNVLAMLSRAAERVEGEKAEKIDAAIADVTAAKEAVAALPDDATKEQIQEATQMVRETTHNARDAIHDVVGEAIGQRIGGVMKQLERLEAKFDKVITRLKNAGKDVSDVEAKHAEFTAKLDAAKAAHSEAQILAQNGDRAGAAQKLREAHAALKDAREILRNLVHEIRGIGGGAELEEESEPAEETSTASTTGEASA